jgi:hypothetical protein
MDETEIQSLNRSNLHTNQNAKNLNDFKKTKKAFDSNPIKLRIFLRVMPRLTSL